MKKLQNILSILILAFTLLPVSIVGQQTKIQDNPKYGPDSESRMKCAANLSTMNEFVKIKVYDYAFEPWRDCFFNCPAASKNIYIQGSKIIDYKIENAETDEIKEAYIDTLMLLYDKRLEYFGEEGKVLGKKGVDLLTYRRDAIEEAYGYLNKSIDLDSNKCEVTVTANLMVASSILYSQAIISADELISNYMKVMNALEGRRMSRSITKAKENIEKLFAESGAADCEALIGIFTPKYEANSSDAKTLKKITELLKQTGCEDSDLFAQASESLFAVEPSAKAGANLGMVFSSRNEYDKAVEYFIKAIEIETNTDEKADYYYGLAIAYQKLDHKVKARSAAENAAELKSGFGEPYILIGQLYANSKSDCSDDKLPASVYWIATDMFVKAKSIDPSLSERADKLISTYSPYFPNTENAFFLNVKEGDTYTVGCWINKSTRARF